MTYSIPRVSIICPAFNEEDGLKHFHRATVTVLQTLEDLYEVEILYIDDGSHDRTLDVIKTIAWEDARVRYLSLSRNFGQQAALTAGLEHATGDAVITMDSDLQHPPELIPRLLERWRDGFDVVLTVRAEDKRLSFGKRLGSMLFYRVLGWLSGTEIRPARSDYRLLSRKVVDAFLRLGERQRFVRGMVQWLGFSQTEVPFCPDVRKAGQTKYTFGRLLRLAADGIFGFSTAPLRVPYFLGAACVGLSAAISAAGLGRSLWNGMWDISIGEGILISSQLLGGCILLSLGVLGEYIGRIYEQVKQRPLYVLKDQSPESATSKPAARELERLAA